MLSKKDLQLLSIIKIVESKNVSKDEKYLFIKLIKECSKYQCMGFLLDNTIYAIHGKLWSTIN